ncbi:MarR family winged helix-turn-helix transcriptional regulator [Photobacterium atrarenae]|uniref:MarR family transcriptional regulator n=1 Tax=Photobacterium atrarenae TaxID=865757 RepID=A0ABY5GNR1_9GAMM|nr:MarR family transcriptional regulator [Photobacterium atrarenae]UTV30998.1 MarR family transcriptional regulator [Photobacterium atrarenae]
MSTETFGIQFSVIAHLWRRHLDQQLAQAGFNDISWTPLLHLDEFGDGINQQSLASSVEIEGSSLVRLLETLELRGHIIRQTDLQDRRSRHIYLTDAGRRRVAVLRQHLRQIESDILLDISDEQIATTLAMLSGLKQKFQG